MKMCLLLIISLLISFTGVWAKCQFGVTEDFKPCQTAEQIQQEYQKDQIQIQREQLEIQRQQLEYNKQKMKQEYQAQQAQQYQEQMDAFDTKPRKIFDENAGDVVCNQEGSQIRCHHTGKWTF